MIHLLICEHELITLLCPSGLQGSRVEPVRDRGVLLRPRVPGLEPNGEPFQVWRAPASVLAREPALPPSTEPSIPVNTDEATMTRIMFL